MLKKLGAELIEVEAVPYSNPNNYIKQSKKIAEDLNKTLKNGVYWGVRIDESLFLGGMSKSNFLESFDADIFFDDQKKLWVVE